MGYCRLHDDFPCGPIVSSTRERRQRERVYGDLLLEVQQRQHHQATEIYNRTSSRAGRVDDKRERGRGGRGEGEKDGKRERSDNNEAKVMSGRIMNKQKV